MKRGKLILITTAIAAAALLAAACQNQTGNKASTSNMDRAGHDMSNMNHNMSNMNHDMSNIQGHDVMNMQSDPGAADQPFDLQFIDSMIHHHNGAIMMAKMVLSKSERPEVKAFAQKVIDDQTKEIGFMQQLRQQWYAGKPSSVNMEMPGMVGGMKTMTSEHMKEMDRMEPDHFDEHFVNMMTQHHEGAIEMAKESLKLAEHTEIKALAENIIRAQQPEIDQMKMWKEEWMEK
jgi:uncharacterized protein (DUF305 family)